MNILIAGDGPAALLAGFLLRTRLTGGNVSIVACEASAPREAQILVNPITPDIPVRDPAARKAIAGALYSCSGLQVRRSDHADRVETQDIPGLAYAGAGMLDLCAALAPLAREAGCRMDGRLDAAAVAMADIVLVSEWHALDALGAEAGAFALQTEDTGRLQAIFEIAPADGKLAFAFAGRGGKLFGCTAIPESAERSTLVVEAARSDVEMSGVANAGPQAMAAFIRDTCIAVPAATQPLLLCGWRPVEHRRVERRRSGKFVLFGHAAATVHHSIALQARHDLMDAEALAEALAVEFADAPDLAHWETAAQARSQSFLRAAGESAHWLAHAGRVFDLPLEQFAFACATRSFRMGYKRVRDAAPEFARRLDSLSAGSACAAANAPPPPMFAPYELRGMQMINRMVFSPMCMYSATDGTPDDFHTVHLGARAVGGFGLVIAEMTNVTAQGRMTPGCAGMYAPAHAAAWRKAVEYAHRHTQAKMGIQLAHAGRKGSIGRSWEKYDPVKGEDMWEVLAPSAIAFTPDRPVPREMTKQDIQDTVEAFANAARMSEEAGFDMIELHMAHGYLLSSFISPLANRRGDSYGGSLENRMRFPREVFEAVRAVFPDDKPIAARISASDFRPDGVTPEESITIARLLRDAGVDIVAVSTAGVTSDRRPAAMSRLYQLALSEAIRHEAKVPTMAIGGLVSHTDCNMIVASGRADLCVMARGAMNEPYFPHHAANEQGYRFDWPMPYARADETVIKPS